MLRIVQNISAAGAKTYYSTADYYTEGQELAGIWRGKGAARLGLSGTVQQEAWDALCDNRDPRTGLPLTVRRKQERSVGYDFNFHLPKSVSLLYGLTRDERILAAFRESVNETMREMESEMQTRVRRGGKNEDRVTGEMTWGEFIHFTSRPVGGIPDPHLHAHCFVHNVTYDRAEDRWKAGQFRQLKQDAPYFEAKFHSRMARRMAGMGLAVERTKKGWEIAGPTKETLDKFSRRTALIEAKAREKGIASEEEKAGLGAQTRERKTKDLSMEDLRQEWRARLTADEAGGIQRLAGRVGGRAIPERAEAAREAAEFAVDHCFDRKSVLPERQLLAEAIKHSVGQVSAEAVEQAVRQQDLILAEQDGRRFATTGGVLAEEQRMIGFARSGRGTCDHLGGAIHEFRRDWLNEGQRRAVSHVLTSSDRVILIRGAAGTGKTSMMLESAEAIEAGGRHVFTFAPSADASRGVLRQEGFASAETVSRLLVDDKLQEQVRGQVMWIDEAGQLGVKAMTRVFDLAEKLDARVILSGDRRQHGSVERGAALRLLEEEAGLRPAEIWDIQRQKGAYKQAVQSLSEGRTEDGFRQLDKLGWIREVKEVDRYKRLASDYVATVAEGKSCLVVSPTHREGEWITDQIRAELREAGSLGTEQRTFRVLQNANLTVAQRGDATSYLPGDVVVFHQNAKGHRKGERITAGEAPLPLSQAAKFQAYHADLLALSPGDVIRVTQNGVTADGKHRLNNGARFAVKGFDEAGNLLLSNGWTVGREFGHLAYGYCTTSHAAQGKTVDRVLIGQSAESIPASSREQFYVSVSRARQQATIYTADKVALLEAVSRSDDRQTATELLGARERREKAMAMQRMEREAQSRTVDREVQRIREGIVYER